MTGAIRLGLLFALTLALSGCALVSITACAQWDLTKYFGFDLGVPLCHPRTVIGTAVPR